MRTQAYLDCGDCGAREGELHKEKCPDDLAGQLGQKYMKINAMAQDLIRQQKQIEMLQGAFGDMAATIRRLTEERLGPEKPLYGRGILNPASPMYDPTRVDHEFNSLINAIQNEGYSVEVDPNGNYSVEKKAKPDFSDLQCPHGVPLASDELCPHCTKTLKDAVVRLTGHSEPAGD